MIETKNGEDIFIVNIIKGQITGVTKMSPALYQIANFKDRPICKEVMNIYVMQSQSFCEDMYVTPKGVWSWDC